MQIHPALLREESQENGANMVLQLLLGFGGALSVLGIVSSIMMMPFGPSLSIRMALGFTAQAGLLISAALNRGVRTDGLLAFAAAGLFVQALGSLRKAERPDAPGLPVSSSREASAAIGDAPSAHSAPTPTVPRELINARSGLNVGPRGTLGCFHTMPLLPPFSLFVGLPQGSRRPGIRWRDRWQEFRELRSQLLVVRVPPQFTLAPGSYVMAPTREGIERVPGINTKNIREMDAEWRTRHGIQSAWYVGGDSEFIAWFDRQGRNEVGFVFVEDATPMAIGKAIWQVLMPAGLRAGIEAALGLVALAAIIPSAAQSVAVSLRSWTFDHFDALMFGLGLLMSLTALLRRQFARFIGFALFAALVLVVTWLTGSSLDFLGL